MKLSLTLSHLRWVENSLAEILQSPFYLFFFFRRKVKDDSGTILLAKLKSPLGWKLECVVWLPTGSRKRFLVLVRVEKKGWFIYCDMIQDFLVKAKNFQQSPFISSKLDDKEVVLTPGWQKIIIPTTILRWVEYTVRCFHLLGEERKIDSGSMF